MAGEEKTALEIILELPSILLRIENKLDMQDTNLKILNTKLNKMREQSPLEQLKSAPQIALTTDSEARTLPTATPGVPIIRPDKQERREQQREKPDVQKLVLGNIKVFSKIKTTTGKPVTGMTINIFDSSNELIRNLRTDENGYYECKLPAGDYTLEMIHPKIKTTNKLFSITKDMKSFEVT